VSGILEWLWLEGLLAQDWLGWEQAVGYQEWGQLKPRKNPWEQEDSGHSLKEWQRNLCR
jgi:hypothetical protein